MVAEALERCRVDLLDAMRESLEQMQKMQRLVGDPDFDQALRRLDFSFRYAPDSPLGQVTQVIDLESALWQMEQASPLSQDGEDPEIRAAIQHSRSAIAEFRQQPWAERFAEHPDSGWERHRLYAVVLDEPLKYWTDDIRGKVEAIRSQYLVDPKRGMADYAGCDVEFREEVPERERESILSTIQRALQEQELWGDRMVDLSQGGHLFSEEYIRSGNETIRQEEMQDHYERILDDLSGNPVFCHDQFARSALKQTPSRAYGRVVSIVPDAHDPQSLIVGVEYAPEKEDARVRVPLRDIDPHHQGASEKSIGLGDLVLLDRPHADGEPRLQRLNLADREVLVPEDGMVVRPLGIVQLVHGGGQELLFSEIEEANGNPSLKVVDLSTNPDMAYDLQNHLGETVRLRVDPLGTVSRMPNPPAADCALG